MRRILLAAAIVVSGACRPGVPGAPPEEYLYVWAGDSAGQASDFLAVIDASPRSAHYGRVVASLPAGMAGTHPHHTEGELGASRHLLANGFGAGRTWLYDLSTPRAPKILTSFGDIAGLSHPHSFIRLADGTVLATFQYRADSTAPAHVHGATSTGGARETGGIVHMDERGAVIRSGSAVDPAVPRRAIFPYAVLPIPAIDRALSTSTDMNGKNIQATGEWVQLWRLSDLTLLKSFTLPPGPRGDEHLYSGEPRLLSDGRSAYVHTFHCGLYLVRGLDGDQPAARFVTAFEGKNCGIPLLAGRYWIQTVPQAHALVTLDISDPERPRTVSTLTLGDDEMPHWVAMDRTGRRIALNSAGRGTSNRLFLINFDPATGALSLDERFRDAGAQRAGVRFTSRDWPHGFRGTAVPHGTVFSR